MRAYELARELGVESKEVLARAADLGIKIASASSGLDNDTAAPSRLAFEEVAGGGAARALTARGVRAGVAQPVPPDHLEAVVAALGYALRLEEAPPPSAA